MRAGRAALALAAPVLLVPEPAPAHPHIWLEARVGFELEFGALVAIDMTWRFDPMLSELLLLDYDRDRDGRFDAEEAERLLPAIYDGLILEGYYAHLELAGAKQPITEADGFSVRIEDGLVLYNFKMHLPEPVDPAETEVAFAVYDETIFVQIDLALTGLAIVGDDGRCALEVVPDPYNPYYYGSQPTKMVMACRPL